jgi:hypothetical protein
MGDEFPLGFLLQLADGSDQDPHDVPWGEAPLA